MKPGEAMEALGLVGSALNEMTPSGVKKAWAAAVTAAHPDTEGNWHVRPTDAATQIATLTTARDLLLSVIAGSDRACKLCKGLGKVRGRFGARDCIACKGTGDRL